MTPKRQAPAWRRYLRFWGSNLPSDVDDELGFHVDMRTRDYMARGMDEDAARAAALARVGRVDDARSDMLAIGRANERRARQGDILESIATDVRFALRSFRRAPGWTAVAVITMALGIGSSTAVFSVVDRLLLRPIAYPGASRIVFVRRDIPIGKNASVWMAPTREIVDAWRRSARSLDGIEAFGRRELTLSGSEQPMHAASIGPSFLDFAGARLIAGRRFSSDDAGSAVLIAESFWRRQFGGAQDVIGKTIRTNAGLLTIVGIVPASVRLPDLAREAPDVWLPLDAGERLAGVVARLQPGVPLDDAQRELETIARPFTTTPGEIGTIGLIRSGNTVAFRRALLMLSGAVALLLLVAAANVAHLLLARGAARERELAIRFAIGAGRRRLVRQLVTESLVLSLFGGVAAALVGMVGIELAVRLRPASMTAFFSHVTVNRGVAAIAATLTLSAGVVVGLLVGLRTARRGLGEALRSGGGGGARATTRLRSGLVVSEIGLSATLLVGALLLVRSVIALQGTKLGFDARDLYGVSYSLRAGFQNEAERSAFVRELAERARQLPDVAAATVADKVPPHSNYLMGTPIETSEGTRVEPNGGGNIVAPDYFAVLGISFLGGHTFDARPRPTEVIVNEAFASQLWPKGGAVGGRFRFVVDSGAPEPWVTVIGVTRNALTHGLLDGVAEPTIYSQLGSESESRRVTLIVRGRTGVDPTPAIRRLASELRATLPAPTITNVTSALRESMAEPRFAMIVLTTFAMLAVVLAAIGLYGVISYSVAQRTTEIGIRMALGASRISIASLVVSDGLRLAAMGIALGLLGATAGTRVLRAALHGVERGDPWSFALGASALLVVSLVACVIPLVRATTVDPLTAVRAD